MATFPSRQLGPGDLALVGRAPIFRELPAGAVREVAASARKVSLRKGQPLFAQGERADAVYLLLEGRVKVSEASASGHSVVLRLEAPGALLGLLAALGGEPCYPVTAEALEPCVAARWDGGELATQMKRFPQLAVAALPVVLARLREVQDQVRELATERVERRVARLVVRLVRQAGQKTPEGVRVDVALTRQELAEMSGTTLYTVSRLLSQWSAQGIVQSRGKKLLVTQPHALVRLAEDS